MQGDWQTYNGGGCPTDPEQAVMVEHHWPGGTYIGPAGRALWDYCTKRWRPIRNRIKELETNNG